MKCAIHGKEMRYSERFGYSCPTPIRKNEDGTKVLEWCSWKPDSTGFAKPAGNASTSPTPSVHLPDDEPPFRDDEPHTEGRFTAASDGPDWEQIGRVKALCGMVNGMLTAGAKPAEVLVEIPNLRQLLRHIEAEAAKQ